ncbi:MAG: L-2-amino-thiazoline-4-carboxylic acid hydrolase [Promethearchaeota archaeon]
MKNTDELLILNDILKSEGKIDSETRNVDLVKTFQGQFDEVDIALQIIKTNIPHLLDKLVKQYIQILSEKAKSIESLEVYPSKMFLTNDWAVLGSYPEILIPLQKAMFRFLGLDNFASVSSQIPLDEPLKENLKLEVPLKIFIQFAYYHVFYVFHALEFVESKETAHEMARKFGEFLYSRPNPNVQIKETLSDFRRKIDTNCKNTHNFISEISSEGHYVLKVTECVWGEALKAAEDPNLMYYLICYGDFFSPKKENKNFELTRNETILQGYPMCDFCYHDRRISSDLRHPNEDFWNSLTFSKGQDSN